MSDQRMLAGRARGVLRFIKPAIASLILALAFAPGAQARDLYWHFDVTLTVNGVPKIYHGDFKLIDTSPGCTAAASYGTFAIDQGTLNVGACVGDGVNNHAYYIVFNFPSYHSTAHNQTCLNNGGGQFFNFGPDADGYWRINQGLGFPNGICGDSVQIGIAGSAPNTNLMVGPVATQFVKGDAGGGFSPSPVNFTLQTTHDPVGYDVTITYGPGGSNWLTPLAGGTSGTVGVVQTTVGYSLDNDAAKSLPIGDYTATLKFHNHCECEPDSVRTVKLAVNVNPSCEMTTYPTVIAPGGTSQLNWFSNFAATKASLAPGIGTVPTNGTKTVSPAQTTTYVLSVSDDYSTRTCSTRVVVATEGKTSIVSAVLPTSRSVPIFTTATAFATIINAGTVPAYDCSLDVGANIRGSFTYQTSDPATNKLTGTPNTPADIPAGKAQPFVISIVPNSTLAPTDVPIVAQCGNADPPTVIKGVNTLLFAATADAEPDVIALAATPSNDGIATIANGVGAFAVASVNVGADGVLKVSANTGAANLPLTITLCESNPQTAACKAPASSSVTATIPANATPTFSIFLSASGTIPLDPASNRVFVRFLDETGAVHGSTSVAVRTQ